MRQSCRGMAVGEQRNPDVNCPWSFLARLRCALPSDHHTAISAPLRKQESPVLQLIYRRA